MKRFKGYELLCKDLHVGSKMSVQSFAKICMQNMNCPSFTMFIGLLLWSLINSFVQGLLTTGYIILLSKVGERVAADMRKTLFASLLRQDVAFFDANKTGQLVNRLTADIQEFKSSFKLVISQVLPQA
ncbi:hypothetical protein GOODEAATRI_005768 [Goodea atripinnis]|uniref:ABC transmembrane type-1 domain-containing protein n=1 Tax=Goodea atripinnis TaxID=208336 RepID=A0ABV0PLD2_9TELE